MGLWISFFFGVLLLRKEGGNEGLVGLGELLVESLVCSNSLASRSLGSLSLGFQDGGLLLSTFFLSKQFSSSSGNSEGIQFNESTEILKRILLVSVDFSLRDFRSDLALNFIRVDDSSNFSVGKKGSWESKELLNNK